MKLNQNLRIVLRLKENNDNNNNKVLDSNNENNMNTNNIINSNLNGNRNDLLNENNNKNKGNNLNNLKNKIIISSSVLTKKNKKIMNKNTKFISNTEYDDEDKINERNGEKVNFFDSSPSTIPSLSRPAVAMKKRNNDNNEFLTINSIEIKPKIFNNDNNNNNNNNNNSNNISNENDDDYNFPNDIEIEKTRIREKLRKSEMLTRRQSSIIFRVQIIQNEIINNINMRKQLYYYGNKDVDMNDIKLSQLDKKSITKETKRRINELTKINEILIRKRFDCYYNFNSKLDFSDFGLYRNFYFLIGDFSDAFWNEVKKIIKSGDEKPDYAITRLARSGVEGKKMYYTLPFDLLLFFYLFIYIHIREFVYLLYLFIYLFICLFIYVFTYLFTHLSICSFINLFIFSFVHLLIYLFIYLFICSFNYLFGHLFIYFSRGRTAFDLSSRYVRKLRTLPLFKITSVRVISHDNIL